jgi:hypothetical protein
MPENTWNVITDSLGLLRDAAALISDANRQAPTPCSEWSVTQVLQHAVGDQLAWAAALVTARTAWAAVASDDGAVPTPLPQGAFPAPTAAGACALDAAVHAWDIAVALGQPCPLSDELAARLLPAARAVVEPLRQFGAYAPALPARPEDSSAAELLRYLGRDPQWAGGGAGPVGQATGPSRRS